VLPPTHAEKYDVRFAQQFLFIAKHLRGGGLIAGRSAGDQVPSPALSLCLQTRTRLS